VVSTQYRRRRNRTGRTHHYSNLVLLRNVLYQEIRTLLGGEGGTTTLVTFSYLAISDRLAEMTTFEKTVKVRVRVRLELGVRVRVSVRVRVREYIIARAAAVVMII